jgi:HD-GYP domain-containing protein (c-di-GMP phosphodiesterase class II)
LSENGKGTLKELINDLMHEMEKNDPSLKSHSTRVANQCVLFLKDMERPAKEINQIYIAALLHDIGMIYIPKKITSKKSGLTETEMAYITKHTLISEKILAKYSALKDILPVIRSHHEAFNGSGYPEGLRANAIPAGSRIINIINSYDNYITNGINGRIMSHNDALDEIQKLAGTIFDKILVDHFVSFIKSHEITQERDITLDSQEPEKTSEVPVKTSPEPIKSSEEPEETSEELETIEEPDTPPGSVQEIISEIIQKFKKNDVDLPVLPEVVTDIQEVINSPSSGVEQLAAIIEKDAVISVRLIAVANSALYRGTEKILSVRQAIPRMGVKETQSIVTTIANKGLYEVKDKVFKKLMEKLWKHSLASAFAARLLAEKLRLGDSEKFYFMGLVHDIGKVLILKTLADLHYQYESLNIDEMLDEAKAVHTSFGSAILRKWGFSDAYTRMCLLHAGPKFKPNTDKEILLLNLAGNIAKKAGFGVRSNPDNINIVTLESRILLNIEPPVIDDVVENIEKLMSDVSDIFS